MGSYRGDGKLIAGGSPSPSMQKRGLQQQISSVINISNTIRNMHGKIKACIHVCLGTTNTVALCDSGNLSDTDLCNYGTFKKAYRDQPGKMPMMMPFTRPLRGAGSNQLKVIGQVKVPLTIKGVQPRWESRRWQYRRAYGRLLCRYFTPRSHNRASRCWKPPRMEQQDQ